MKSSVTRYFIVPAVLLVLALSGCGSGGDGQSAALADPAATLDGKTLAAQTSVYNSTKLTIPKNGKLTYVTSFNGFFNGALGSLKIVQGKGLDIPTTPCSGTRKQIHVCQESRADALKLTPTSIEVLLNSQVVLAKGAIPRTQGSVTVAVAVNTTNNLQVNLTGPKGAYITVSLTSENTQPLQNPTAAFTFSPSSGTVPLSVLFDASISSSPNGSIVSYNWDFGDGSSDTTMNPFHTYYSTGTFAVTLTVTDSAGKTATSTVSVVANAPLPLNVSFTYTVDTSTGAIIVNADATGSSSPNGPIATYMWDFGDGSGPFLGSATTSYIYAAPGTYTVTLTETDTSGTSGMIAQNITVP